VALAAPQHTTEADREAQHLHATGHGHAVVAVLVHDDQHAQREQEGKHGGDHAANSLACRVRRVARTAVEFEQVVQRTAPGPMPLQADSSVRQLTCGWR
jgi:hypothetical protein